MALNHQSWLFKREGWIFYKQSFVCSSNTCEIHFFFFLQFVASAMPALGPSMGLAQNRLQGPLHGVSLWCFLKKSWKQGQTASWGASWSPNEDIRDKRKHLNMVLHPLEGKSLFCLLVLPCHVGILGTGTWFQSQLTWLLCLISRNWEMLQMIKMS